MMAALEQRALKISILVTLGVSTLGIVFGLLSGSRSVLFDGIFSTIDAAMSGLALVVARLVVREASQRFQHGYWHLEPLVAGLNGSIASEKGVAELDDIRGQIGQGISIAPEHCWFTVAFTADVRWA